MYKNAVKSIHHIFFFISSGLILLSIIAFTSLYYSQQKHIEEKIEKTTRATQFRISYMMHKKAETYLALIDLFQNDPDIIDAYEWQDRDAFLKETEELYKKLNINFKTTHFYIHNLDRTNFIRVHNINLHSDLVNRHTLITAQKRQKYFYGIEFGFRNNLTLRVVKPWIVDGELIGYIELGEEIGHMFPKLSRELDVEVLLSIKKELMNQNEFQQWLQQFSMKRKLINTKDHIIINTSLNIDENILSNINSKQIGKHHIVKDNGSYYSDMSIPLRDTTGKVIGLITVISNITKEYNHMFNLIITVALVGGFVAFIMLYSLHIYLRKMQKKIDEGYEKVQKLTFQDGMTALYNRRHFDQLSSTLINQSQKMHVGISFTMIDIDYFKRYNDTYGHSKGDDVIKTIAKLMKDVYQRETDHLFRMGGEEFAIISIKTNKDESVSMANKLRQKIKEYQIPHSGNEASEYVTVSIGVSICHINKDKISIDELYKQSDNALYRAKREGRNRVEYIELKTQNGLNQAEERETHNLLLQGISD